MGARAALTRERSTVETVRTTKRHRSWLAWTGSPEELLRIGRELEKLVERRKSDLLAQFDVETETLSAAGIDEDNDRLLAIRKERRQEERLRLAERWGLKMTLSDGNDETEGALEAVSAEFDRRQHYEISYIAIFDGSDEFVRVKFDRRSSNAVFLMVKSTDQGWGRQVMSKISDEIDAGRPWWWWVHTPWGAGALTGLTNLALFVAVYAAFSDQFKMRQSPQSYAIYVGLLLGCVLLSTLVGLPALRFKLFPNFEIVGDGAQSTGTRFTIYMAALAVSVVAGIWVNLVT